MKRRKKDPLNDLYSALAKYIKSVGGSVVVAGGIRIEKYPNESEYKYHVSIACAGISPVKEIAKPN